MKLMKAQPNNQEPTVSLGNLKGGAVFRFAHLSFDEAIKEDAFYMVAEAPEKSGVVIINLADGKQMMRDKDHRVIEHKAALALSA
jgi:hypothetical protein